MTKFVIFEGNDELIVTTRKNERDVLTHVFEEPSDRDLADYDRTEIDDLYLAISVNSSFRVN